MGHYGARPSKSGCDRARARQRGVRLVPHPRPLLGPGPRGRGSASARVGARQGGCGAFYKSRRDRGVEPRRPPSFVCFVFGTPCSPVCLFMVAISAIGPDGPEPVMNACPSPASRLWGDCLARWGGRLQCSFFVCFIFSGRSALCALEPERGWPGRVAARIAR